MTYRKINYICTIALTQTTNYSSRSRRQCLVT